MNRRWRTRLKWLDHDIINFKRKWWEKIVFLIQKIKQLLVVPMQILITLGVFFTLFFFFCSFISWFLDGSTLLGVLGAKSYEKLYLRRIYIFWDYIKEFWAGLSAMWFSSDFIHVTLRNICIAFLDFTIYIAQLIKNWLQK